MKRLLEILPGFALGVLVIGAQKIRRVKSHNQRNVVPLMPLTAQPGYAVFTAQQSFRGGGTQRADSLGLNHG